MTVDGVLAGLLLGLVLGAAVGAWGALHLAAARRDAAVSEAVRRAGAEVAAARAELDAERRVAGERERAISPAARAASVEALDRVLEPVASALGRMEQQMVGAAREREVAFASLREHVGAVAASAQGVAGETRALAGALRSPHVRGRWGELQLERVVDLAGMVEHCDFTRQAHARGDDEGAQRPDLVVHLAGGKQVVVDAKVPFTAYLE